MPLEAHWLVCTVPVCVTPFAKQEIWRAVAARGASCSTIMVAAAVVRRCFAFLCRACIVHPQHTMPVHVSVKTYMRVLRNRCVSVVGACISHRIPDRELNNGTYEDRQSVLVLSTPSFLMCCITADTIALSFFPLMLIYASLRP